MRFIVFFLVVIWGFCVHAEQRLVAHTETHGDYILHDYISPINRWLYSPTPYMLPFFRKVAHLLSPIEPFSMPVSSFSRTLSTNTSIMWNLLAARPSDSLKNVEKSFINFTLGGFGLLDVASALGLESRPFSIYQDFLVWGLHHDIYLSVFLPLPSGSTGALTGWLSSSSLTSKETRPTLEKWGTTRGDFSKTIVLSLPESGALLDMIPDNLTYEMRRRQYWQSLLSKTFKERVTIEVVDDDPKKGTHSKKEDDYDPYAI